MQLVFYLFIFNTPSMCYLLYLIFECDGKFRIGESFLELNTVLLVPSEPPSRHITSHYEVVIASELNCSITRHEIAFWLGAPQLPVTPKPDASCTVVLTGWKV